MVHKCRQILKFSNKLKYDVTYVEARNPIKILLFYILSTLKHQRCTKAIVRVRVFRRGEAKSPLTTPYAFEDEKSLRQIMLR